MVMQPPQVTPTYAGYFIGTSLSVADKHIRMYEIYDNVRLTCVWSVGFLVGGQGHKCQM